MQVDDVMVDLKMPVGQIKIILGALGQGRFMDVAPTFSYIQTQADAAVAEAMQNQERLDAEIARQRAAALQDAPKGQPGPNFDPAARFEAPGTAPAAGQGADSAE